MTDAGLASERTDLAWQRTGLTHAATGLALFRLLPTSPARPVLALIMIGVGAMTSLGTRRLEPGRPHRGWLAFLAGATCTFALASAAVTLLG